jgi:hypothetical protein
MVLIIILLLTSLSLCFHQINELICFYNSIADVDDGKDHDSEERGASREQGT